MDTGYPAKSVYERPLAKGLKPGILPQVKNQVQDENQSRQGVNDDLVLFVIKK